MLIRNKLILRFTALTLLVQVALSGFVYWFSGVAREQRFTDRLAGEAALAARLLVRTHYLAPEYLRNFHPRQVPNLVGEEMSLFNAATGQRLYANAYPDSLHADHQRYFARMRATRGQGGPLTRFQDGERETVGLRYHHNPTKEDYILLVGGYDDDGWRQLWRLGRGLLVGNVGGLALLILAGWYFADEALRPIARMVRRVRQISAEHLSKRLDEGNGTDELAQLAATFNAMLAGLEAAFEQQRAFVAHASHELRTPLAVLRGTLETAVAYDQSLPEARTSMEQAMREIQKLIELTNGLLTLARADGRAGLPELPAVRLDECVLEAVTELRRRRPGFSIGLTFGEPPADFPPDRVPYLVRGHAPLLQTALVNLLDNAAKYGAPPISLTLDFAVADRLRVCVTDHGPGLSPTVLARAFEPLYRGEQTRDRPGFGLGLAVVQKVAELHGGTAALAPAPGGGTAATLLLPLD